VTQSSRRRESEPQPRLHARPLRLREAQREVQRLHRHHGRVAGCLFSIGAEDEDGKLRGVAIIGRPVSRLNDDGWTAEVLRVATDGCPNVCSFLYSAAWRACRAIGYLRLGTYTLVSESGSSLRAAGWVVLHECDAKSWDCPGRPRLHGDPQQRLYWQVGA
jgi:hypothetical protein